MARPVQRRRQHDVRRRSRTGSLECPRLRHGRLGIALIELQINLGAFHLGGPGIELGGGFQRTHRTRPVAGNG